MDLPASDGSASFDDYAEVVLASYPEATEDVVLVGHSLGSMTIPVVAAARPASLLVFLCGVIPNFAGQPWDGTPEMARSAMKALHRNEDGSNIWLTAEAATLAMYADCAAEDAQWAFSRLRPQNPSTLWSTPYPLSAWPDTRRAAVVGLDDAAITIEYSRFVSRERLDVTPVELPGGHSPFLANPGLLADTLVGLL
jgi:pimeloyl-ACP methyl ester carboxylesterase